VVGGASSTSFELNGGASTRLSVDAPDGSTVRFTDEFGQEFAALTQTTCAASTSVTVAVAVGTTVTVDGIIGASISGPSPAHGAATVVSGAVRYHAQADALHPNLSSVSDQFGVIATDGVRWLVQVTIVPAANSGVSWSSACESGAFVATVVNTSDVSHDVTVISTVPGATTWRFTLPPAGVASRELPTQGGEYATLTVDGVEVDTFVFNAMLCGPNWSTHRLVTSVNTPVLTDELFEIIAVIAEPDHGTVAAARENGLSTTFRYTPDHCFVGTDRFTLRSYIDDETLYFEVTVRGGCATPTPPSPTNPPTAAPTSVAVTTAEVGGAAGSGDIPILASTGVDVPELLGIAAVLFAGAALLLYLGRGRPRRH
jgi:hypothetical protein